MLNKEKVSKLNNREFQDNYVVSVYLDIDTKKHPSRRELQPVVNSLMNQASDKIDFLDKKESMTHNQKQSLLHDLETIKEYIIHDLKREQTPGIAIFASKEAQLWETETLPHPAKNRIVINRGPYVRPLLQMLDDYKNFCTLLISKDKARLFSVFAEQIKEESIIFDEVPGKHGQGGFSQTRFQRHIEVHVDEHLKRALSKLERFFAENPFDYLIVSTTEEVRPMVEKRLHPYLKERLVRWIHLDIDASETEVLTKTVEIEHEINYQEQLDLLSKAEQRMLSSKLIVYGLEDTLKAVIEKKVENLLVQRGFGSQGLKCYNCNNLRVAGELVCEICGSDMKRVEDIVEEAIEAAYRHGSSINLFNPDISLEQFGSIAALLAY